MKSGSSRQESAIEEGEGRDMKLENKVAIVTGGAKGMGREISLALAR